MNTPITRAGRWLLDRSRWDDGMRGFFVRINATGSPDDMHRHILAIEREAYDASLTGSGIGLPDGMTRDDAYVQGMSDAEDLIRNRVEELIEKAGGRCVFPEDYNPNEMNICETHSELLFDDECEDQPRQLLAVLDILDEHT
jgi:hypothetical protein